MSKIWNLCSTKEKTEKLISEYILFEDRLKSLYGWSLMVWIIILYFNPYYFADLVNDYTDHMRHEYVSWAFLQVGFRIFTTPLGKLGSSVTALHPHPSWPMLPSLYPIGLVIYFLPFGIISNLGILADVVVHKLMIISFLLLAYICIYYFALEWKKAGVGLFSYVLAPVLFYICVSFWALNGFYDVIPVLLIILSIIALKREKYINGLLFISTAMFMHFRAWVYIPLFIYSLNKIRCAGKPFQATWRDAIFTASSVIMILLSGYTLYLASSSVLKIPWEAGKWVFSAASLYEVKNVPLFVLFSVVSFGVSFYLYQMEELLTSSTIVLFWVFISFTILWRPWYPLFFFPALLLPKGTKSKESVFLWNVFVLYFLDSFVDPIYIVSLIHRMFFG